MTDITSPLKAIRAKCLDCAYTAHEVKHCPCTDCALHPFRLGKNPFRTRNLSDEQRQAAAIRLEKARASKKHS